MVTHEGIELSAFAKVAGDWVDATFDLAVVEDSDVDTFERVADSAPRSSHVAGRLLVAGAEFTDVATLGTVTLTLDFDAEMFAAALNGDVFRALPFDECEVAP